MKLRVPAIVLAVHPVGEADLIAVLLTAEHGKLRVAARSARRSKRRFAGGLGAGAVGDAELTARAAGLWRFEEFAPRHDHAALGRDLTRFAYVAYLCELTDTLLAEHHPEPALFAALARGIARTLAKPADPRVLRSFELALLGELGHLPAFDTCCVCGTALGPVDVAFDVARGGALCPAHGRGCSALPAVVRHAAIELRAGEMPELDTSVRRRLRELTQAAITPLLPRPLRSVSFFAQLAALPREAGDGSAPGGQPGRGGGH